MTKVGNNVIQRRVLEQNSQYRQKSRTVYLNNKPLLLSDVCIMYIIRNSFIFFRVSKKYIFRIIRVLQLSVHPPPHHNPW
jgi:hypothetical protein